MFKSLSYAQKIFIVLMGTSLVTTITSMIISILFSIDSGEKSFKDKLESIAYVLADSSIIALNNNQPQRLHNSLSRIAKLSGLELIIVYTKDGTIFSAFNPEDVALSQYKKKESFEMTSRYAKVFVPVRYKTSVIGYIHLQANVSSFRNMLWSNLSFLALIFWILLIVVFFISNKMQKILSRPILSLAKAAKDIQENQNFSLRVASDQESKEIIILYDAFNEMLSKMQKREEERDRAQKESLEHQEHLETLTLELEERVAIRTADLQESMELIKATQNQLVESDKMASLGSLVAGVAHEVNTPLGNAITVLSVLRESTQTLQYCMENNQLKKSLLVEELRILDESSSIIQINIMRAADLVKSFKKISVDQVSEDKRKFSLREYSHDVFITFQSILKKENVNYEIKMDKDIILNSYPGVYAQILSNLIQNALIHAFDGVDNPKVTLYIEKIKDDIILRFEDNGQGIDKDVALSIFEPFVTTKRNQGGSGLGLNIVYNLVTQKLQGYIKASNHKDGGAEFKIQFKAEI